MIRKIKRILVIWMILCMSVLSLGEAAAAEWKEADPSDYVTWEDTGAVYYFRQNYLFNPFLINNTDNHALTSLQLYFDGSDVIPLRVIGGSNGCRYGYDGSVLFTTSYYSEDGDGQIALCKIKDSKVEMIFHADCPNMNNGIIFLGSSSDGRYHYLQTMEQVDDTFCDLFYIYDDQKEELSLLNPNEEGRRRILGYAVSPDGNFLVIARYTDAGSVMISVYSQDAIENYTVPLEGSGTMYLCCNNNGDILFSQYRNRAGTIRHNSREIEYFNMWFQNCISNIDNSQFLLSDGDSIWFYSFGHGNPSYVCRGEYAMLMVPDCVRYDTSQAYSLGVLASRNLRYFIDSFDGYCFYTPYDCIIYKINDFDQGNVRALTACEDFYDDALFGGTGKNRYSAKTYAIADELNRILLLDEIGLRLIDVSANEITTLYDNEYFYGELFVNSSFTRALLVDSYDYYVSVDLESGEIRESGLGLEINDAISIQTESFEGIAYENNGHLMLMDYDTNICSVDTSIIEESIRSDEEKNDEAVDAVEDAAEAVEDAVEDAVEEVAMDAVEAVEDVADVVEEPVEAEMADTVEEDIEESPVDSPKVAFVNHFNIHDILSYSIETHGTLLWCVQADAETIYAYKLNDDLELEQMPVIPAVALP